MTDGDRRGRAGGHARTHAPGQGRATPGERALRRPRTSTSAKAARSTGGGRPPAAGSAKRRPSTGRPATGRPATGRPATGRSSTRRSSTRRDGQRRLGHRMLRLIWGGVAGVVLVAVLLLFVFPTRTYLDQRHELAAASRRVRVLSHQNADLAARVDKLHSDAEIERLAREQYHLVRPGEQAFAILPAPAPTTTTTVPPRQPRTASHRSWWQRLTSWL